MPKKTWTTHEGRGDWQQIDASSPDDATLVARVQLRDLVGVSNTAVISKVIAQLGIEPVEMHHPTRTTRRNGGQGMRVFDVPRFRREIVEQIRTELVRHSADLGAGRHSYHGTTFSWERRG